MTDLPPANFLHGELESGLLKDGPMKRARFTEEETIGVLREDENAKLKKFSADQMLDAAALRKLLAKKWQGPPSSAKVPRICRPRWASRRVGPAASSMRKCRSHDGALPVMTAAGHRAAIA